jgi:hypothetical protein
MAGFFAGGTEGAERAGTLGPLVAPAPRSRERPPLPSRTRASGVQEAYWEISSGTSGFC